MNVLNVQILEELWASMPEIPRPTDMTVSWFDWLYLWATNSDPNTGLLTMQLWVDPTLKRGECYEGRPDKERLGERFKDYLVVNPYEDVDV